MILFLVNLVKKKKFVHTNHYLALSTAVFRREIKCMIVEIILKKRENPF